MHRRLAEFRTRKRNSTFYPRFMWITLLIGTQFRAKRPNTQGFILFAEKIGKFFKPLICNNYLNFWRKRILTIRGIPCCGRRLGHRLGHCAQLLRFETPRMLVLQGVDAQLAGIIRSCPAANSMVRPKSVKN